MANELVELTSLIEFASVNAEKIFRKTGILYPMYHAITRDGQNAILNAPPGGKDLSVAIIKAWFEIEDIDRYVFMDEAWILDDSQGRYSEAEIKKATSEGLEHHPDRREIVLFSAENRRGEMRTAKRFILRPEIGKPKLSPLTIDPVFDHSEGSMVGLLNPEKRK